MAVRKSGGADQIGTSTRSRTWIPRLGGGSTVPCATEAWAGSSHLRQDSNPHWPGRNRLSCPLNDGGPTGVGELARIRTGDDLGCSQAPFQLGYELMALAGDRGIEPRSRPGLEPSALPRASPISVACVLPWAPRADSGRPWGFEPSPGVEPDPPPYQGGVPAVWTSRASAKPAEAAPCGPNRNVFDRANRPAASWSVGCPARAGFDEQGAAMAFPRDLPPLDRRAPGTAHRRAVLDSNRITHPLRSVGGAGRNRTGIPWVQTRYLPVGPQPRWSRQGLNLRPPVRRTGALPVELRDRAVRSQRESNSPPRIESPRSLPLDHGSKRGERGAGAGLKVGFEPTTSGRQAGALPLSYSRLCRLR